MKHRAHYHGNRPCSFPLAGLAATAPKPINKRRHSRFPWLLTAFLVLVLLACLRWLWLTIEPEFKATPIPPGRGPDATPVIQLHAPEGDYLTKPDANRAPVFTI